MMNAQLPIEGSQEECGGQPPHSSGSDGSSLSPAGISEAAAAGHGPPPLRPYDYDAFIRMHVPPRELLLDPWLPRGGTAMIYGPRGCGKTYLSLNVAHAIASGSTFLRWTAPTPRRVLYIDGEMSAAEMQSRIEAIAARSKQLPHTSHLRFLSDAMEHRGLPDLSDRRQQERYQEAVEGVDLIIVDNLSTLCRGLKENDADTWASMQEWILTQRRAGRSVLLIHHAGKGGGQRGTSRKEDILDTVIALRKPPDWSPKSGAHFEVHIEKSRGFYGQEAEPFQARLSNGVWQVSKITSAKDDETLRRLEAEGLTVREIAEKTKMSRSAVQRRLAKVKPSAAEQAEEADEIVVEEDASGDD